MSNDPRSVTEVDEAIGAAIRTRRKQLGVPMTHMSELVGITHQQWQKYEAGENRVSAAMLTKIAEAMELEPADLLPGASRKESKRAANDDGLGRQLQHAFARIKSKRERRLILDLAKRLAGDERAPPKRGARR